MTTAEDLTRAQNDAVARMIDPSADGGALLAFDVGLGKTRTGLLTAKALGAKVILAVVPLSTIDSWAEEAAETYPELRVRWINSDKDGRRALVDFEWKIPGIYLIGHQYWEQKAWDRVPVRKRKKDDPDKLRKVDSGIWSMPGYMLIFDESHRSANTESWTFKALMNLHPDVYRLSMSGTFMGDKFDGAYGAAKWIWPHRTDILPNDIHQWRGMWAETKYSPFGRYKEETIGERDAGAFVSALPCYIRMESPLPPAVEHKVWVDLLPEQMRVYNELDQKMVAWIEEHPLVTTITPAKRARQRQATLAMPSLEFDDEGGLARVYFDEDAASAKIDRLFFAMQHKDPDIGTLLHGEQLLILTDSQQFAKLLTQRMNEHFGDHSAREWSGKTPMKQRPGIKQAFIDRDIEHIVGVQAAMGTGTNGLQFSDSRIVVFMSLADWQITNEQGIGRLNRMGQMEEVHAVFFLANNTIDSGQQSKYVQDALKRNKMMRKKAKND